MKKIYSEKSYEDIINLPHHKSKTHPHMSMKDRAAQFAPFAALTGYNEQVKETARLTDKRIDLDDSQKLMINEKLVMAIDKSGCNQSVSITYFKPDEKKEGGVYISVSGVIKRIYEYESFVLMDNGLKIPVNEILNIDFINRDEENL